MVHRITSIHGGLRLFGIVIAICITSSCFYDNEEELYPGTECDTTAVSFADEIFPIFQGNCSIPGCHVPGGSGVGLFESYDQIKSVVDAGKIEARVLVAQDMPPSAPLSDCNLMLIEAWIADGALNN